MACFLISTSISSVPFWMLFTVLAGTLQDITFCIRKGDNLVSGVPSIVSNIINLGKFSIMLWYSSESESICGLLMDLLEINLPQGLCLCFFSI